MNSTHKKIFSFFFFFNCILFSANAFANTLALTVKATTNTGTTTVVATPAALSALTYVSSLEVILTGTMSSFTVTDSNYSVNNWGVSFTPASGSAVTCTAHAACDSATITVNPNGLPTLPSGSSPYLFSGTAFTLDVTIKFPSPAITLPQDFVTALSASSLTLTYAYTPSSGSTILGPDSASWQPDFGALLNPPILQNNNQSVLALTNAFEVTNISPPATLDAACPVASSSSTDCLNDGSTATTLISTTNGGVSGYVIGFWKDSQCAMGGFKFNPNWQAYAYDATADNSYTCTYTNWNSSLSNGGASSTLGCPTGFPTLLTNTALNTALTTDLVAIPYYTTNPKSDLQYLINNPGTPIQAADSCISYVYLSNSGSSQSSYTSGYINKGDVYGVMVWALNYASDTTYNVPNYSFAHSNIFYTTAVEFVLASTVKDASLTTSKDCFVVTAASGDLNSLSVHYWRFLRDSYLTPMGVTRFYYRHAKAWAYWLDQHPTLKPPLHFAFEKSGSFFYHLGAGVSKAKHVVKNEFDKFTQIISKLFDNSAGAQELPPAVPQDVIVVQEDMATDPFFEKEERKKLHQPIYDFYFDVGILIPTDDVILYDNYYSSQPSVFGELGLSKLYWQGNWSMSIGGQGRYLGNSERASVDVLGTGEGYTRKLYVVSLEVQSELRYRNINYLLLQPGLIVAAGVTRLRESISADSSSNSSPEGVTYYSPIFEIGGVCDLSLSTIFPQSALNNKDFVEDILLRFRATYNNNNSKALSTTGYFLSLGFAFLLN